MPIVRLLAALLILLPVASSPGGAAPQAAPSPSGPAWTPPPRVVVPQLGRAVGRLPQLAVERVDATVEIADRIATTTLEFAVRNRSAVAQEASLLVPVPVGAVVVGFTFEGPASESTAKLLARDEARGTYDAIVARERDPALLEWAGWNLLRSSVFPVPAGGQQRMRITWEEHLEPRDGRLEYLLPRSEIARGTVWRVRIGISSHLPLAAVYSPTHELRTISRDERSARFETADEGAVPAGSLRLAIVRSAEPAASVVTYPDPSIGGGYFLLLVAAPPSDAAKALPRDVVLVLDRSGSMAGAPIEEAKSAAAGIVTALRDGERVNIVDFANGVSSFGAEPVALDATTRSSLLAYIAGLRAAGGTNIHDALVETIRQSVSAGSFGSAIFLTDGLPTIGRTRESDIRRSLEGTNAARRIFTVGLGPDLNAPLLDRIADATRADATYVAQGEALSSRLAALADRLSGPVLADLGVDRGAPLDELVPRTAPDLFRGTNLVLLGRYRGETPFTLRIRGRGPEGERIIEVPVDPRSASVANAFVPRLWASRRIAELVAAIRDLGLDEERSEADPRFRELTGEILRLSTTFGVLTEYTSMLALEGSRLDDWNALEVACGELLRGRAIETRSGAAAVSQGVNWNRQKLESNLAGTKGYLDERQQEVVADGLVQCGDVNLWKAGDRWADARLVGRADIEPDETIDFGSDAHRRLVEELASDHRQSSVALEGDILIVHRGRTVLVRNRPW